MLSFIQKNKYESSVYLISSLLVILESILVIPYLIFLSTLSPDHFKRYSVIDFFIYFAIPILYFILLTGLKKFKEVVSRRYTAIKTLTCISCINGAIIISYMLYKWFFNLLILIPFSPELTLFIIYLTILLIPFLIMYSACKHIINGFISNKALEKEFLEFDFCYFLEDTFRDMALPHIKVGIDALTGKSIYIYHKDRLVHTLCLGPTGGGKSSMTVITQIYQDLKNKAFAVKCLNKAKLYEAKVDTLTSKITSTPLHLRWMYIALFNYYRFKAESLTARSNKCNLGVTCIEPKGDLIDTIVELIDTHFPILKDYVIVIDPLKDDCAKLNVMNGEAYTAAEIVGSSLTEMQGGAKDFFAIFQANVCRQIVLLLKYVHGDDCSMEDLSKVLSDSKYLKEEIEALDRINASEPSNKYAGVIRYFKANTTDKKMAEKFQELTLGLKAILEQLTLNPRMSAVMCGKSTVNLDEVIADGKILLINTAMGTFGELGHLFGRFCIMHYEYACFRRDIKNPDSLIPNYTYIDEFPLYRNKRFVEWLTLGRGYKTAAFIAAQGLSGLVVNGNSELRDMVLSCCRNKLIFGGISVDDAEIFSKEFGEEHYEEEVQGVKETGYMQGQASYMTDVRKSWKTKTRFSTSDILYLDDKKIVAKVIKDRKIMAPRLVSVDFLQVKKNRFTFTKDTIIVPDNPEKNNLITTTLNEQYTSYVPPTDEDTKEYIKQSLLEVEIPNELDILPLTSPSLPNDTEDLSRSDQPIDGFIPSGIALEEVGKEVNIPAITSPSLPNDTEDLSPIHQPMDGFIPPHNSNDEGTPVATSYTTISSDIEFPTQELLLPESDESTQSDNVSGMETLGEIVLNVPSKSKKKKREPLPDQTMFLNSMLANEYQAHNVHAPIKNEGYFPASTNNVTAGGSKDDDFFDNKA